MDENCIMCRAGNMLQTVPHPKSGRWCVLGLIQGRVWEHYQALHSKHLP